MPKKSEVAIDHRISIVKTDEQNKLVYGYAIVCAEHGEDYYDLQGHHIPESVMVEALSDFMVSARTAKAMHDGDEAGQIVMAFPVTAEIAKALDWQVERTGAVIAMRPNEEMLAKFMTGEFTGFSIGGWAGQMEEVSDA